MKARIQSVVQFFDPYLDTFFATHPTDLFVIWIYCVAGFGARNWAASGSLFWHAANLPLIALLMGVALLFLVSRLWIREQAVQNDQWPPVSRDSAENRSTRPVWVSGMIYAAGVLFVLSGGVLAAFAAIVGLLLWVGFELLQKQAPEKAVFFQPVAKIVSLALIFLAGWFAAGPFDVDFAPILLPYLLVAGSIYLVLGRYPKSGAPANHVTAYDIIITAVSATLTTVALFLAYLNRDPLLSTSATLLLPFYAVALVWRRPVDLLRIVNYSILILATFAGMMYPLLFLPLAGLYYLARYYYQRRFGLIYPRFNIHQP